MQEINYNKKFIFGITIISALGGLLFGYDWVVIGGAKPFYERFFDIANSSFMQGWAMSSALIGCLLGAILSGVIADRLGRKLSLIVAAVLFTVSAFGTGAVNHFNLFIIYRLIGGLGIGLASAVSPMYIAEIAPAKFRGMLVSVNQLTIVVGMLLAQTTNFLIADSIAASATDLEILNSWNGQMGWRWMFWAEVVPASLFFILAFFIPESPRYLVKAGITEKAKAILVRIGGEKYAQEEENNIAQSIQQDTNKVSIQEILSLKYKPVLVIGIVIAVFQQWCGINVIFNYAEEIFVSAGYSVSDMLFNIIITGTVNVVFTLVAMRIVDRLGRRKLMLSGSIGLAIIYFILGGSYILHLKGIVVLILVLMAIATYAMTLAPITWVVLSEIFPNRVRGIFMAIATTALWVACFILTYTFPILNKLLNAGGTFCLYSFICLVGFLFIRKNLPETKGKSLEEIEAQL